MALGDLLAALEDEEAAEHELARQETIRRAEQIITDARARAVDACADVVATAEAAARQQADSLLTEARSGARRALRDARDTALEAVLAAARERLLELPGTPAGVAAARACLREALAALPPATSARVHPADAAVLSPGSALELVADPTVAGAVAADDQGRYVDNTYLTRLANTWAESRMTLSRCWDEPS